MHFAHVTDRKHHLRQGAPQPSGVLVVIDEPWSFPSHGRGYAFGNIANEGGGGGEVGYGVWEEANGAEDVVRARDLHRRCNGYVWGGWLSRDKDKLF